MFKENNDGNQQEGAVQQQQEAQQQEAPVSVFDIPHEVQMEDDGLIPMNFDYGGVPPEEDAGSAVNQLANQNQQQAAPEGQAQQQQAPPEGQANENAPAALDFNRKPQQQEQEGAQTQEQIIADLKSKGFDVTAPGGNQAQEDPRISESNQLKSELGQAQALLGQTDDVIIKEKFTDNLKRKYTNERRQHLIGSEEFNLEIEADIEELNQNKFNKNIVADNIRRDVQGYASQKEAKLQGINTAIQSENETKANENRTALQAQFTDFHKNGFMNVDIPANIAEEVYNDVISGKFNQEIKNDHNLVAQFALFTKLQKTFTDKLGQPTYGEGVKAAFDQFNKNGQQGARNPLAQMSSSQAGNGNQGEGGSINGRFAKPKITGQEQQNQNSNAADNRFG